MKIVPSAAALDEALREAGDRLVVIDFFAEWFCSSVATVMTIIACRCPPCKGLAPWLEEQEKARPEVLFLKVDVDASNDLAAAYEISAMPTIKLVISGEVVDSVRGADTEAIEAAIEKHIVTITAAC